MLNSIGIALDIFTVGFWKSFTATFESQMWFDQMIFKQLNGCFDEQNMHTFASSSGISFASTSEARLSYDID